MKKFRIGNEPVATDILQLWFRSLSPIFLWSYDFYFPTEGNISISNWKLCNIPSTSVASYSHFVCPASHFSLLHICISCFWFFLLRLKLVLQDLDQILELYCSWLVSHLNAELFLCIQGPTCGWRGAWKKVACMVRALKWCLSVFSQFIKLHNTFKKED